MLTIAHKDGTRTVKRAWRVPASPTHCVPSMPCSHFNQSPGELFNKCKREHVCICPVFAPVMPPCPPPTHYYTEELFSTFQRLADENMRVTEEREKEMRQDLDELHGRHVELKRKFRTLYLAYRQLRYLVRSWQEAGGSRSWGLYPHLSHLWPTVVDTALGAPRYLCETFAASPCCGR